MHCGIMLVSDYWSHASHSCTNTHCKLYSTVHTNITNNTDNDTQQQLEVMGVDRVIACDLERPGSSNESKCTLATHVSN
jgi:hypothetical protein